MELTIRATENAIEKYHEILLKEWSSRTLRQILELLWEEIGKPDDAPSSSILQLLKPEGRSLGDFELRHIVICRITNFVNLMKNPSIPALPSVHTLMRKVPHRSKTIQQAEATWTYLILQTLATLRGETGFFLDTQSLLYLVAVHYLLPKLKESDFLPEHDCLVNALYMHVFICWTRQPDHLYYLQSVLMDYLGDIEQKIDGLTFALELTPVEDDSYLTKLQDCWLALVEAKRIDEAYSLLLNAYRVVPMEDLAEVKEMIARTDVGQRRTGEIA